MSRGGLQRRPPDARAAARRQPPKTMWYHPPPETPDRLCLLLTGIARRIRRAPRDILLSMGSLHARRVGLMPISHRRAIRKGIIPPHHMHLNNPVSSGSPHCPNRGRIGNRFSNSGRIGNRRHSTCEFPAESATAPSASPRPRRADGGALPAAPAGGEDPIPAESATVVSPLPAGEGAGLRFPFRQNRQPPRVSFPYLGISL